MPDQPAQPAGAAPSNAAPADVVPGDAAPGIASPGDVVPDVAAPDDAVLAHAVPAHAVAAMRALPPLPPVRGAGLAHVIIPGTALWFVALVVLLFLIPTLRTHDAMLWLWTALAGWLLGFVGLAIYGWQRAAARRGSRGASRAALEEQIGLPAR